jgi:hypothetical protein
MEAAETSVGGGAVERGGAGIGEGGSGFVVKGIKIVPCYIEIEVNLHSAIPRKVLPHLGGRALAFPGRRPE